MWKIQTFPATQILGEINFGEFRSCKTAIFAHFRGTKFLIWVNFGLQKVQKIQENQNSEPPNVVQKI